MLIPLKGIGQVSYRMLNPIRSNPARTLYYSIIDSYILSMAYWSDRIYNHPGMPPPPPPPQLPSGTIPPEKNGNSTGKEDVSSI